MKKIVLKFSSSATELYSGASFGQLKKLADPKRSVLLTDENVYKSHQARFKGWNSIILKPGEEFKVQSTADAVVEKLIDIEADRQTILVGVGGGVITDLTGYVASVYMRGIRFGFVPTTVLGLVDASIGGKNGIDVGPYKNMIGTIRQPAFILQDTRLLSTLPRAEWINGFAEIIKHACIKDAALFRELEKRTLDDYRDSPALTVRLIQRNALIKARVVQRDEWEKDERRLLNFGHTLGHALETQYELMHGQAIAIGMTYACQLSEKLCGFSQTERVTGLLQRYKLPTYADFDPQKVFHVLKMDKKRERKVMNYVLLEKTGKAVVKAVPLKQLEKIIQNLSA